jgi:hypothetical protein
LSKQIDASVTVYKSGDGDYDIYIRDGDDELLTLRVDASQLNLLADLFQLIQKQGEGAAVSIGVEAEIHV